MVFGKQNSKTAESNVESGSSFKIDGNSRLFALLSDGIYADKISAVIRELACNAYDAHQEANQTRPFQVKIPSEFDSEFRIRDFGFGLSEEDMNMYTTYGVSTKNESNAYIGAFGIGSKSPFAYTSTFNVTSYQRGMARSYTMYVDEGFPKMTLLGKSETAEPDGLEVFLSVLSKDVSEFKRKAEKILSFMTNKIEFLNVTEEWVTEVKKIEEDRNWEPAGFIDEGYYESNLAVVTETPRISDFYLVQGNVQYTMSHDECREIFSVGEVGSVKKENIGVYFCGMLKVPNGTFIPQPSRERLAFSSDTKRVLKSIFEKVYDEFVVSRIRWILQNSKTFLDLHRLAVNEENIVKKNPLLKSHCFTAQPEFKSYADWLTSPFTCDVVEDSNKIGWMKYRVLRNKTLSINVSRLELFYVLDEGKSLSTMRRYQVFSDFDLKKKTLNLTSRIAPAIFVKGSNRLFTDSDYRKLTEIDTLPKISKQEREYYKSWAGNSVKAESGTFTRISLRSGDHYRLDRIVLDDSDITDLEGSFYVTSNTAYRVELFGEKYNVYTRKGQEDFARNFFFMERPLIEEFKARNPTFDTYPDFYVYFLPEGSPFGSKCKSLVSEAQRIVKTVARRDARSKALKIEGGKTVQSLSCRLFDEGLFDIILKDSKYDVFRWWDKAGRPSACLNESFRSKFVLPSCLFDDKKEQAKIDFLLGEGELRIVNFHEIWMCLEKKYPLINILSSWNLGDEEINDIIEFIKLKEGFYELRSKKSSGLDALKKRSKRSPLSKELVQLGGKKDYENHSICYQW